MYDFYNLLDIYAAQNNINRDEALHLWYRRDLEPFELLDALLQHEGISVDCGILVNAIKVLGNQARQDQNLDPWAD